MAICATTLFILSPSESKVSEQSYARLGLSFPLAGLNQDTASIRNVFDHSTDGPYYTTARVVAYTGEQAAIRVDDEGCMAQRGRQPFRVNGRYVGAAHGPSVLCYDGHPGYDFSVPQGTPVRAAAGGFIRFPEFYHSVAASLHNTVEIQHPGTNCSTFYLHMKETYFDDGDFVPAGRVIGASGNVGTSSYYLHFEVQCDGRPVDPYGWDAEGPDPHYVENVRLWTDG